MLEKRTKGKATIGRSQKTHLLLGVAAWTDNLEDQIEYDKEISNLSYAYM